MAHGRLQKQFGRIIRERRIAAGLSQEALADAAGLHRTYISLVERGLRDPQLSTIQSLARGLGTTIAELVDQLPS